MCTVKSGVEYHISHIRSQDPFAKESLVGLMYSGIHLETCCSIKKAARQHNLIIYSWTLTNKGVRATVLPHNHAVKNLHVTFYSPQI